MAPHRARWLISLTWLALSCRTTPTPVLEPLPELDVMVRSHGGQSRRLGRFQEVSPPANTLWFLQPIPSSTSAARPSGSDM